MLLPKGSGVPTSGTALSPKERTFEGPASVREKAPAGCGHVNGMAQK